MQHPIIARITWPELRRKAENIKPVPRALMAKMEAAAAEIGPCGIVEEIRLGMCHAD